MKKFFFFLLQEVNAINVEESADPGYVVPDAKIIATDIDTNSSLKYSIDWSKTTGKKNSVDVGQEILEKYDLFEK